MQGSARRADDEGSPTNGAPRSERSVPVTFSASEWRMLRAIRPNILVIGVEDAVRATVSALVAELPGPVAYLRSDAPPPDVDQAEMLVVPDVAAWSPDRQREWVTWLGGIDARRPQIVATSDVPVYPLVESNRFSGVLYYRLNTILVDMVTLDGHAYRKYSER